MITKAGDIHSFDRTEWVEFFRVISVRRSYKLLTLAGMPPHIVNSPDRMLQCGHVFWYALLRGQIEIDSPTSFMDPESLSSLLAIDFPSMIDKLFLRLNDVYPSADVEALRLWARRHFLSVEDRIRWSTWVSIWVRLSVGPQIEPQIDGEQLALIQREVGRNLGALQGVDDPQQKLLFDIAQETALSTFERTITKCDPLVVAPDGNDEMVDILLILELIIQEEAAFRVWSELQGQLTISGRRSLFEWARAEATHMDIPQKWIDLAMG